MARAIGVALVDYAAAVDRYNVQEAQAEMHAGNKREREQAERAHVRAFTALHRLQDLIAEAAA